MAIWLHKKLPALLANKKRGAEPESAAAALEKDYLTTVEILDQKDYAPVGTLGKRSNLWG